MKITIYEGFVGVYLLNIPLPSNCNAEDDTNCWLLDHRTEGLQVIKILSLLKPLCRKPGLELIDGAIKLKRTLNTHLLSTSGMCGVDGKRVHVLFM